MAPSEEKFKSSIPDEKVSEGEDDFSTETVGEILYGYQVSVCKEKEIMLDQIPRHSSLKEREHENNRH